MSAPKVMTGARAKVGIHNPLTGETQIVGTFSNVSYGLTYDTQAAYTLGRYSAAEIDYTAAEVVAITCSGYRVIGHGPHKDAAIPKLEDLLLHEYLEMVVIDRQQEALGGEPRIAKFRQVRPTGYSGGHATRSLSEVTYHYVGIMVDDEEGVNAEHPTASDLP